MERMTARDVLGELDMLLEDEMTDPLPDQVITHVDPIMTDTMEVITRDGQRFRITVTEV